MSYIPIIDDIGFFGPIIIFIISIFVLWGRAKYLKLYLVVVVINTCVNKILKNTIQSPRPVTSDKDMIYKSFDTIDGVEKYGMPSGHAQSVSSSILYLYLVTKSVTLLIGSSFIGTLTILQRYRFKRHSITQLLVGCIIGFSIAYISYYLSIFIFTC